MHDVRGIDPLRPTCYRRRVRVRTTTAIALVLLSGITAARSAHAATPAAPAASAGPSHWVDRTTTLPDEPLTAVAVDPADDRVIYAGLDGFLFRSDDGGDSFSPVLSFPRGVADDGALTTDDTSATNEGDTGVADPRDSALQQLQSDDANDARDDGATTGFGDDLPDGDVDARARQSGISIDDIPLAPLANLAVPPRTEAGVRTIAFVDGSAGVFYVATPRGLFRTTNAGLSFLRLAVPGGARENDIRDVAVDKTKPTSLYVATAGGLFLSKDGGASFVRADGRVGTTPVVCLAVDGSGVVVGTERGLLRSRDGGASFIELLLRGHAAFPVIHAVAVADTGAVVYAGVDTGLFAAERGSAILEHYDGMPDDPPTTILPDPVNVGGVVVATRTGEGGAFFSNDIGLTTVDIEALPANQVVALARERKDSARLWAATERGLFRLEPGTGVRVSKDELVSLRARFEREPPLGTVVDLALAHSGFDVDVGDQQARAGFAHLLPELNAGYQFDYGDSNQQRTEFLFVVGVGQPPTSDPEAEFTDRFNNGLIVLQPQQKLDHRVWVNLTWDLDQVVLAPQTMTLGRNAMTMSGNRVALADEVRALYIMRRRLLAEVVLDAKKAPSSTSKQLQRVHKELEILEVEARLAGLTGADVFDSDSPSVSVQEER